MARRASTVAGFTLVSRVLGYLRDLALAYVFGAGAALDAFVAAQTIPNVFRRLVAEGTLMVAFVPMMAEARERGGKAAMRALLGAVLGGLIPILVLLVGLGMVFPGVFVDAFASGFDGERQALARHMTRIMMPFLACVSLVAVAGGVLNSEGVFGPPAAAPILLNVGIIGAVAGGAGWIEPPVAAAAWGVLIGGVLQLGLQLPFLARKAYGLRPRWDPHNPELRQLAIRLGPAVLGVGVYQLNVVVIRQLASYLPGGQLSWYFYATRLEEFALGVFAVSISIAALPTLSRHAAAKDAAAFRRTFARAFRATQFITVPSALALWGLAGPIVLTLFQHGQFTVQDARGTDELLRVMGLALVPIGAIRVMVPTYYAVGDTRLPVWAALGSLATTAGLGAGLIGSFEIWGLVVATTAAAAVQALTLALWMRRRVFDSVGRAAAQPGFLGHLLRCAGAAAVSIGPVVLASRWVDFVATGAWARFGLLAGAVAVGAAGYLGAAHVFGIPEVQLLREAVGRRIRRAR